MSRSTRFDLVAPSRVRPWWSMRTIRFATRDHMLREQVGRVLVVTRDSPRAVIGILTRSDFLAAHAPRLRAATTRVAPRWVGERVSP